MAKIYVSSTFLDLQDYRTQVERVIRRMGHEDMAMEYYVASDERPVDRCLKDVADCDIYLGVYAWRYGWVPEENNQEKLSITEMEYRQADKVGKPCFIFLLDEDHPWPRKFIDKDTTRIESLRNEASAAHTSNPFTIPEDLARKVVEVIHIWEKERERKKIEEKYPGLVRGVSVSGGTVNAGRDIAGGNIIHAERVIVGEDRASKPAMDVAAYFDTMRKRYGALALEGLTPPQRDEFIPIQLSSVFVEQSVRENPPPVELPKEVWERLRREKDIHVEDFPWGISLEDVRRARESYYEKPSRPVLDVLTDGRLQRTILLGDPGSGKSTLARYMMLSLMDSAGDERIRHAFDGHLPLLIELRSYAGLYGDDKCDTFLEFLEYLGKTEGWHLSQAGVEKYLQDDGRAVVIFDGLDEIFDPESRERITHRIAGFCNDFPKARVIVTSRVIGYRRKILTDAGFTHFTLQDLDEKQVEEFVRRWYDLAMSDRPYDAKERRERILKSFKESSSIRQLAGNPMLLTIMAIIGKHQELPRERWKLYDHAASVLIQHWDVNKHLQNNRIQADFIGEEDKKELLRRLAYRMQSGEGGLAGNYIHRDELQAEFESYLKERYIQSPADSTRIARAMIEQFRERNFILSLYGANLYGFVHRAFLEYFCAWDLVWKFEKTKTITFEQLKQDVYDKHWMDRTWHEVLRLVCGIIDERWAGEIIDDLTKKKREMPRRRTFDITSGPDLFEEIGEETIFKAEEISFGIVLAVQCFAEPSVLTWCETASPDNLL